LAPRKQAVTTFRKWSEGRGRRIKRMNSSFTRKRFLLTGCTAAAAFLCGRGMAQSQPGNVSPSPAPAATPESADYVPDFPDRAPLIDRARVKRFVIAAHSNFPAVRKMLEEEPTLINGTIDWGNGDFETALGGASHMGRREIAEFLLEHNARMDIFAATMLGQIEIVKAAVAAYPKIVRVPGPHGIPLIVHAQKGGPAAAAVLDFLQPLVAQA